MFAKVKNHATVQRALDLSAGTSDYIHAGTQVLLNTLSLVLLPPTHSLPTIYTPSLSFPVLPRSVPGTKAYLPYKSHNMFCLLPLVPCSMLSEKAKQGANTNPFFIQKCGP